MILFTLSLTAILATGPLTPIEIYNGAWTVTPVTPKGPGAPDKLINHCFETDAYYLCEQKVNGKAVSLVVFTPTEKANQFHVQNVLPTGFATGRTDLTLDGPHWTYSSKDVDGAVTSWYRTENYFTGRDKIHFEQYKSSDGQHWDKNGEGDEVRDPVK